jgi:hypothetical protein
LRAGLIRSLARRKGLDAPAGAPVPSRDDEYDRLAEAVRSNVNWGLIERIVGLV